MKAHNDKTFRSDGILKEVQVLNLASLSHAIIQVVVSQRCNFGRTELYQFLYVCVRTLICVEFFYILMILSGADVGGGGGY